MANIHLSACLSVCRLSACLSVCLALWVRVSCSLGCSGTLCILGWWWTLFYLLSDGITGFCHDAWYINAPGLQKYWKNNCLARALARVSNRFSKFAMWLWGGVGVGVAFHVWEAFTNQRVQEEQIKWCLTRGAPLLQALVRCSVIFQRLHYYWRIHIPVISWADLLPRSCRFIFM